MAIAQIERLTAARPQQVLVDQGFRGKEHHPEAIEVLVCSRGKPLGSLKRLLKRRSAIEPVIGHGKADHALGRNDLQGQLGDRLNALLVGCGFNLRKLCHFLVSNSEKGVSSTT